MPQGMRTGKKFRDDTWTWTLDTRMMMEAGGQSFSSTTLILLRRKSLPMLGLELWDANFLPSYYLSIFFPFNCSLLFPAIYQSKHGQEFLSFAIWKSGIMGGWMGKWIPRELGGAKGWMCTQAS